MEQTNARLFFGGTIETLETPDAPPPEALLVRRGRIEALGSRAALTALCPEAAAVDLEGAALLPAFLDAHSHFTQVAYAQLQLSLRDVASDEALVEAVRAWPAQPGQWIQARDFDHNRFPGAKNPSLAVLDRAAPRNPLVIQHQSGHMGLLNTAALQALGITPQTPSPAGGRIEVVNGRLTGYLEENAFMDALKKLPPPDQSALFAAFEAAQQCYAARGITTVQDGMVVEDMFPLYEALLARGLLRLDLTAYVSPDCLEAFRRRFPGHVGGYRGHLRLGGLKIFLDGSPQGRTAWVREPYVGGGQGYGTMSDAAVTQAMELAGREGLQLLAHCNGDQAVAQFLRCLAAAEQKYPRLRTLRPVIVHGQLMGRDQLAQARDLGAMVSFFVAHVYHWGDVHLRNLGPARAAAISPAASALAAGLPFTFHQDAPVIQPDMFETLWCAACRETRDGVILGPEERISPRAALEAVTRQAAWQYGEEARKGTLAPGKQADLLVADRDPLAVSPQALCDCRVLATYQAGNCVYRRLDAPTGL